METILFDSWSTVYRTAVNGVLAYISLVVLLRISGRRTLSKMNAFDFVVTIALGSTLATILLNKNVALAEGVVAFALLIGLQYLVTWSSVRVGWIKKLVTGEPALLVSQGKRLTVSMRRARVTEDELRSALRSNGVAALDEVAAVVLETDGSFSVLRQTADSATSSLQGVAALQPEEETKQS